MIQKIAGFFHMISKRIYMHYGYCKNGIDGRPPTVTQNCQFPWAVVIKWSVANEPYDINFLLNYNTFFTDSLLKHNINESILMHI